jgi:hypothetical protein
MLKDLTPRERSMLVVLRHATEPLSLAEIQQQTGYKSEQPFRASLRYLAAAGVTTVTTADDGTALYAAQSGVSR